MRIFAGLLSACILGTWFGVTAAQACVCDCDGDGEVTVNELVAAVDIALGLFDVSHCVSADHDDNGEVTVDEVLVGVLATLNGCPLATATPTPEPNSPTATAIDTATNTPTAAATVTFTFTSTATSAPTVSFTATVNRTATSVPTATDAPTATNVPTPSAMATSTVAATATVTVAATATATATPTAKSPPTVTATVPIGPTPGAVARTCHLLGGSSQLALQSRRAQVVINLTGSQVWRFAAAQPDGTRNIVSLPSDTHFDCVAASISTFKVAGCMRMDPATQAHGVIDCAGGVSPDGYDAVVSIDHNTNMNNVGFPQDPECDDTYRNPNNDPDGELVTSWLEDGGGTHVHIGVCNSGAHLDRSGAFAPGGLRLTQNLILRLFVGGTCTPGVCPADTAPFDAAAGDQRIMADMSSGSAKGVIFDFDNIGLTLGTTGSGDGPSICGFIGSDACATSATGAAYAAICSDPAAGSLQTGRLVSAVTLLDLPSPVYDAVATIGITCQ